MIGTGERETANRLVLDEAMRGLEGLCLLVMSGSGVFSFPLPECGEITIGRSDRCGIVVSDAQLSREHLRVRVDGERISVVDLGSSNGTRVGDRQLVPNAPVEVLPGELVSLGTTVIVMQLAEPESRRSETLSHAHFEARVDRECARAERGTCGPFAVLRLRFRSSDGVAVRGAVLAQALAGGPIVGSYAPHDLEILAPNADGDAADALARRLEGDLLAAGVSVEIGIACHPRDGRTAEALVARAGERTRAPAPAGEGGVIAHGSALERMRPMVARFAAGTIPVLLLGETGVGKEVLSGMIHALSPRAGKPLVCLNCAALPEALLESELFGHERGAYTGAVQTKPGILEAAKGGTVFLDEVAEMPLAVQAKLLRVIDQREVLRLGTTTPRPIDVRFIAATNKNLEAEVQRGAFREDLFYRLNAASIVIPPLRERREEILPLARTFVTSVCAQIERATEPRLSPEAGLLLEAYAWPGNVRELRNMVERAVLLAQGDVILPEHLPTEKLARRARIGDTAPTAQRTIPPSEGSLKITVTRPKTGLPGRDPEDPTLGGDPEQGRILKALQECDFNQTQAAEVLGMSRRTLVTRLASYGWTRPRRKAPTT